MMTNQSHRQHKIIKYRGPSRISAIKAVRNTFRDMTLKEAMHIVDAPYFKVTQSQYYTLIGAYWDVSVPTMMSPYPVRRDISPYDFEEIGADYDLTGRSTDRRIVEF